MIQRIKSILQNWLLNYQKEWCRHLEHGRLITMPAGGGELRVRRKDDPQVHCICEKPLY